MCNNKCKMADDVCCCEAKLSSSDKSNEQYKKYATTMYAIKNQSRLNTNNTNTEQGSTNKIEENTHNVFKVFFYFHHYFNLVA